MQFKLNALTRNQKVVLAVLGVVTVTTVATLLVLFTRNPADKEVETLEPVVTENTQVSPSVVTTATPVVTSAVDTKTFTNKDGDVILSQIPMNFSVAEYITPQDEEGFPGERYIIIKSDDGNYKMVYSQSFGDVPSTGPLCFFSDTVMSEADIEEAQNSQLEYATDMSTGQVRISNFTPITATNAGGVYRRFAFDNKYYLTGTDPSDVGVDAEGIISAVKDFVDLESGFSYLDSTCFKFDSSNLYFYEGYEAYQVDYLGKQPFTVKILETFDRILASTKLK